MDSKKFLVEIRRVFSQYSFNFYESVKEQTGLKSSKEMYYLLYLRYLKPSKFYEIYH